MLLSVDAERWGSSMSRYFGLIVSQQRVFIVISILIENGLIFLREPN